MQLNGFSFPDHVKDPIEHLKQVLIEFVKEYDDETKKRTTLTIWLIELYRNGLLIEAEHANYLDLSKTFRKKYPFWRAEIGIEDPPRTPRRSSRLKQKRLLAVNLNERQQQQHKLKCARKLFRQITEIEHE